MFIYLFIMCIKHHEKRVMWQWYDCEKSPIKTKPKQNQEPRKHNIYIPCMWSRTWHPEVEFGRFGSNRWCPMFRYSGEKIPMSDSDVYLFGNYAGEAGDCWRHLTIVSRLAGRPRVVSWMHVGVDNNRPPATANLCLRRTTRRTIENGRCPTFRI